jgi:general nucleoside transport system permease protein
VVAAGLLFGALHAGSPGMQVATVTGSLWLGLVCGALAGSLVGILLAGVQIGLTRTRWGLRTRAVGEHPVAADTVGIWVLAYRYRNVILAGLIAGIGGAYFTIGSVGSFGPDMTSGEGYIALAPMIFGRYTPFGAIGAALLFGFTTQLQSVLSSINVPIQSNLLLLTPYVVTIVVVAGLVGKVRGPRAEGVPFIKS